MNLSLGILSIKRDKYPKFLNILGFLRWLMLQAHHHCTASPCDILLAGSATNCKYGTSFILRKRPAPSCQ